MFKAFSMTTEYFQLPCIRTILIARLDNFFDKIFYENWFFLDFISFTFSPIILLPSKISERTVPHFLRMNVSNLLIEFCIDISKNESVVTLRSSPIFLRHTLDEIRNKWGLRI